MSGLFFFFPAALGAASRLSPPSCFLYNIFIRLRRRAPRCLLQRAVVPTTTQPQCFSAAVACLCFSDALCNQNNMRSTSPNGFQTGRPRSQNRNRCVTPSAAHSARPPNTCGRVAPERSAVNRVRLFRSEITASNFKLLQP